MSETEESFRRSWEQAMRGETRPISELWSELDSEDKMSDIEQVDISTATPAELRRIIWQQRNRAERAEAEIENLRQALADANQDLLKEKTGSGGVDDLQGEIERLHGIIDGLVCENDEEYVRCAGWPIARPEHDANQLCQVCQAKRDISQKANGATT